MLTKRGPHDVMGVVSTLICVKCISVVEDAFLVEVIKDSEVSCIEMYVENVPVQGGVGG